MSKNDPSTRQPIDYSKMNFGWWKIATIKVAIICVIIAALDYIVGNSLDGQPRWLLEMEIIALFVSLLPLCPFPPRNGEDQLTVKEGVFGFAIISGGIIVISAVIAALCALFIGYMTIIDSVSPVLNRILSNNVFWLSVIAYLLILIYGRLDKRS